LEKGDNTKGKVLACEYNQTIMFPLSLHLELNKVQTKGLVFDWKRD